MSDFFDTSHYREVKEDDIAELDKANLRAPRYEAPPLSSWTLPQRVALYNVVEETAKAIESRVIRPVDERVREHLQQREARPSAVSGSLAPRDKKAPAFDSFQRSVPFEHTHVESGTLICDARFVLPNFSLRFAPFVQMENRSNLLLPYICLSNNMQVQLRKTNEHTNAHAFFSKNAKKISTVASLMADASENFGLRLQSVLVRKDTTLELVFHVGVDACFFAVVSCGRMKVSDEVDAIATQMSEATERAEKLANDQPTLGASTNAHDVEQLVAAKANGFSNDGPINYIAPTDADSEQRLLGLATALIVFDPTMSPLLLRQSVAPAYLYFVACQCIMREDGVAAYKSAYEPQADAFPRQKRTRI